MTLNMIDVFTTTYGHTIRVDQLSDKEVDGWPMKQYKLSWSEGKGRHKMTQMLDGPIGEMFHAMWLWEKEGRAVE